jgi:arginyl-tRNA synthetase
VAFPENGYKGEYIRGFGRDLFARDGARWVGAAPPADIEPIKQYAIERALGMIAATLERLRRRRSTVWQSERALHDAGDVGETLRALDGKGYIDRRDDAVWLKTTALWGDDKDRVVVKSDSSRRTCWRTSPTTARRSRAASTSSATSGAPTTTATSRACRRR